MTLLAGVPSLLFFLSGGGLSNGGSAAVPAWLFILFTGFVLTLFILLLCYHRRVQREHLRSEQKRKLLLQGGKLGLWEMNTGTGRIRWGETFLSILGYSAQDLQPHIETWYALLHPDDRDRSRHILEQHLKGELPLFECELRIRNRKGEWLWFMARGKALYSQSGRSPTLFINTVNEITERIHLMDQLKTAITRSKESDRLKAIFLANISHELRTPLNGIIGFCEMLLEEKVSDLERKDYGRIILKSGEQLLAIVNDILDVTRIEAGQTELNLTRLSLQTFLKDTEQFFAPQFEKKGIRFSMVSSLAEGQDFIVSDSEKLGRILTNLIGNALKFTSAGQVTVSCHGPEGKLVLIVEDTGRGIPAEYHHRIFDKFSALEDTPAGLQGAGLGLSISRGYAESLGGTLTVESEPGKGSRFTLILPWR